MATGFHMNQGNTWSLGLKGIFIFQTKYINEMLKKFQMQDSKPIGTPMVTGCKLSQTNGSKDVQ